MNSDSDITPGSVVRDVESDDESEMIVLTISDAPCDDEEAAFVRWDYNQNPLTVADENEKFGYDAKQPFATVVFQSSLDRVSTEWESLSHDELQTLAEDYNIKLYKYPVQRLVLVEKTDL